MTSRFIEIHTLTSYPASLLNRDDAGFAKRIPFGGAVRTRVSSQCLKRHWRTYDGENGLASLENAPVSVRSRVSFEKYVVEPLVEQGVPLEVARIAATKVIGQLLGGDAKADKQAKATKGKKAKSDAPADESVVERATTSQVTVLGRPELSYLASLAKEACAACNNDPETVANEVENRMKDKQLKQNLAALMPGKLEAGLGAALFGRMVTGDLLSRTDAAIHVAHAFTVHAQQTESDYFSAIDDLEREDGAQGSGHINASELTSGLFYGYTVVDVPLLLSNLGGDHELASEVVRCLTHIVAEVSPGAKKGSTAPYAKSHLVLVEAGNSQPRTLANAFLRPAATAPDVIQNAYAALADFREDELQMYGAHGTSCHAAMSTKGTAFEEGRRSLQDVASWAKAQVLG